MSMITPITVEGFPRYARPWNNITPFTYRDGLTYLEVLEGMRTWLKDSLVPHIDGEMSAIGEEWNKEVLALVGAVETAMATQAQTVNANLEDQNATVDAALDAQNTNIAAVIAQGQTDLNAIVTAANAAMANAVEDINIRADQWLNTQISNNDIITTELLNDKQSGAYGALSTAVRDMMPYVNVNDYGAKGDGVTDDTAAIQAAINAAGPGGKVVFDGDYLTGPLTTLIHQTLEGVSQFLGTGGSPSTRLKFTGLTGAQVGLTLGVNNTIRNLIIWGPGYATGTTVGIKSGATGSSNASRLENVGIYHWNTGAHFTSAYYATFLNVEWSYNAFGLTLTTCYNVAIFAPRFNCANADGTIYGRGINGAARALNIYGGSIERYLTGIAVSNKQAVNLFGVYFESSGIPGVNCIGVSASARDDVSIGVYGCMVYLNEHLKFVDAAGMTDSTVNSHGNKFVCPIESTTTPFAYSLGTAPTIDGDIAGDSWAEVDKGNYMDNANTWHGSGISNLHVRQPKEVAVHGGREYIGRDIVIGKARTIRSGAGTTAERPLASSVTPGAQWFDTELGKPIWSTGAAWRDAAGVAV